MARAIAQTMRINRLKREIDRKRHTAQLFVLIQKHFTEFACDYVRGVCGCVCLCNICIPSRTIVQIYLLSPTNQYSDEFDLIEFQNKAQQCLGRGHSFVQNGSITNVCIAPSWPRDRKHDTVYGCSTSVHTQAVILSLIIRMNSHRVGHTHTQLCTPSTHCRYEDACTLSVSCVCHYCYYRCCAMRFDINMIMNDDKLIYSVAGVW